MILKSNKYQILILIISVFYVSCKTVKSGGTSSNTNLDNKKLEYREEQKLTSTFFEAQQFVLEGNNDKAIERFKKCIDIQPSNAASHYELAQLYYDEYQPKAALEYAEKAVEINPKNKWYWLFLSNLQMEDLEIEKALGSLNQASSLDPNNVDLLYRKATLEAKAGKYKEAIESYDNMERILGLTPNISLVKHQLYAKINDEKNAVKEIEKLIEENPKNADYYNILSEYYESIGDAKKAEEIRNKSILLDPENGKTHLVLAQQYRKNEEYEKSFEELKKVMASDDISYEFKISTIVEIFEEERKNAKSEAFGLTDILIENNPKNADSYTVKANLFRADNQPLEARKNYLKSLELNKNNIEIWSIVSDIDLSEGDYESLYEHTEQAIEIYPSQPHFYLQNGIAAMQLDKNTDAVNILESGIEYVYGNDRLKASFYQYIGDAYNNLKDYKNSDENYDKSLSLYNENAYVLNNYSYYLSLREEKLEKAAEMSKKSNELLPSEATFQDTYAWVLFKQKKYKEALNWIEKAIDNSKVPSGEVFEHYADILYHVNKKEKALEFWKKAKALGGTSEVIDKKIQTQEYHK